MDVYIVCKLCALIEWCITVILCMWEVFHAVGYVILCVPEDIQKGALPCGMGWSYLVRYGCQQQPVAT